MNHLIYHHLVLPSDSGILSPDSSMPSPAHTRSYGKAKKTEERETFYKGYGVVDLPGDINGLTKKLHLLATEFFTGKTTVRNELVHSLDALLRFKQLTHRVSWYYRSFSSIIMIVYKSRHFAMRRYEYGGSCIVSTIESFLAQYATKAMLTTAAKTAMRGALDAAMGAIPLAHKVACTIADAAKKRKMVDIDAKHSQEPQLKKAFCGYRWY